MVTGGGLGAYLTLALFIGLECVGIPLPGETALIAAGVLARRGDVSLPVVIAVAAAAAIAGDSLGYTAGRHLGRRLLDGAGPLRWHRRMLREHGEPFFARHGAKAVFLARWLAWVRLATPLLAGASAMPYRRFLRWNVLGAVAWATTIGVLAYALGAVARHLIADVVLVSALLAVVALGVAVVRRVRTRPAWRAELLERARSLRGTVTLCVLLTVLLRAPFFATPLGVDEGGLAFVARHWVRHGTSVYGNQWLDRPPLLVALIRLAVQAGGATGVRLLGALAAGALVLILAALARAIAGDRAGRCAAVAAAVLASAISLDAVYTPAELLAAVPASASVLCLIVALRGGRLGALVAAGALATGAALVKQSFLDAGLAGAVFLAACALARAPRFRWTWPVAWAGGALLPVLAVLAASEAGYVDGRALPYALLGFRLEALRTLAGTGGMFVVRFAGLLWPLVASGLVVAVALVPAGLRRVRGDRVVTATLLGWLAGGAVGVIGGGTYFAHYLIEIVPVSAVLAGVAVAAMPAARRIAVARGAVAAAGTLAVGAIAWVAAHQPHRVEHAVGAYVHDHARPGDTAYVLYARANVLYYTGLPTPFPYDWSLMLRAQPAVRPALYRMLESPRRPTWIVSWQEDDRWRLDRRGIVDVLLARYYRPAATVDGHPILRRAPPAATGT